jgi:hypothetical protein
MNTDTGSRINGNNAHTSRWTEADRSAWFVFCHSHPTLAQSLVNVNNGTWEIIVGTHPPTFVHQRPGETRTDLQRRVMRMYPIHAPNQKETT